MDNDFKKYFGSRVKHFRNLLGYSQEKLAEKVGISSNTVSYIERGKNTISFTKLPALCNALKIEPYQLFINTNYDSEDDRIKKINELLKTATDKQLAIILNLIINILDL